MSTSIVLLHGWGMNAKVWQPFAQLLSDRGYQMHALELPGHGQQPWAGQSSLEQWAQTALDNAPDQAIWCAWSLGGLVAIQAARAAPTRVNGLLQLASTPKFVQEPGWPHAVSKEVLTQFGTELAHNAQATLSRFLALQVRGSANAQSLLRSLKSAVTQVEPPGAEALLAGLNLLLESDLRAALPSIQTPIRWLLGERDSLVPGALQHELQQLGQTVGVIEQAAHAPFLSHPEQCFAELERLMADV